MGPVAALNCTCLKEIKNILVTKNTGEDTLNNTETEHKQYL